MPEYLNIFYLLQMKQLFSLADANLIHVQSTPIMRFGCSLNKLFDYFASGKPILSDLKVNYDLIEKYQAGIVLSTQEPSVLAETLCKMSDMPMEERKGWDKMPLKRRLIIIIRG